MPKSHTKHRTHNETRSTVRIIGGKWRRHQLTVTHAKGLRPTGDRIRETLFNWLTPYIHEARVLDLFAGTGALGLEALSRGAAFVHFIEQHRHASQQINHHFKQLHIDQHHVNLNQEDALNWLSHYSDEPFNILFLDPPFDDALWQPCINTLSARNILAPEALIYVESHSDTMLDTPIGWELIRNLKAGQIKVQLFKISS